MNSIKVTEKNLGVITKILEEAEGKARVNTVSTGLILRKIKRIEEKLTLLKIPKKHRNGIMYEYCQGGKKRGWTSSATRIVLIFQNNYWHITSIERNKFSILQDRIILTNEAKLAIPSLIQL